MESDDLTIEILQGIRDEARETNKGLDDLRHEVRGLRRDTNARFGETNGQLLALERRQTETEVRLATDLVAVVGAINEVKALLIDNLSTTLKDHERRIAALEAGTGS